MTTTVASEYRSALLRELAAQHEQLGEARGEAQAILTVLEARGVPVPEAARTTILSCADPAQVDRWLKRAASATTIDEVVGR
jgi:hypothetical protein